MKPSLFYKFLFRSNYFFHLLEVWWKRRFTQAGIFMLCIVLVSAILGVDTTQNMMYQMFTFSVSVLLIAMAWSLLKLSDNFRIERELPDCSTVGEKLSYRLIIVNKTGKVQKGITFYEDTQDPRPSFDSFMTEREPGEGNRNFWDRKILYYRWKWLIHKNRKAWFPEVKIPDIQPGERVCVVTELIPHYRGYIYFKGGTIARSDPFGLFKRLISIHAEQQLLVLPKRYPVPSLKLSGSREYHSGGIALASSVGNSHEFLSLRSYKPGDPVRNIHWKSMAKTGELITKEFQDEYFVRHGLILDTFNPGGESSVFEEAVSVASSFIQAMKSHESILDLMFVGNRSYCLSSGRGLASVGRMLEILACVQTSMESPVNELIPLLSKHIPLLSACVCVLLEWDDSRKAVIDLLIAHEVPVKVIVVTEDSKSVDKPQELSGDMFHVLETGKTEEGLRLI